MKSVFATIALAASLSCAAWSADSARAGSAQQAPSLHEVSIASDESYRQGRYVAMPSVWGRWADPSITGYDNRITIRKSIFPAGTRIYWRFANRKPLKVAVNGYNFISYGRYWNIDPEIKIASTKLSAIQNLELRSHVRLYGDLRYFNLLTEFFLTKAPRNIETRVAEIGWLQHAPPETLTYFQGGRQIGLYKDKFGQEWLCASHEDGAAGLYVKFLPKGGRSRLNVTIDALGSLRWLIARKIISADTYFNGAAVGIEPLQGTGSAIVDRFDVAYR